MFKTPSLTIGIALLLSLSTASALEQSYTIQIPAQPLPAALDALAQQTGIKPFFPDELMAGKVSQGISGHYTTKQALRQILAKSGLTYQFNGASGVAIRQAKNEVIQEETTLPPVKVKGKYPTEKPQAPQKIDLDSTDPYNPTYTHIQASTSTKTDTPLMETPFSIKVLPQQVLRDQQVVSVRDALKNVAGVVAWGASQNVADTFISRGFTNHRGIFRDGYMYYDIVGCCPTGLRETANIDHFEFLKGPASILFGRAEPGGTLNMVTKQPLATPYYSLQQQAGSYDFYRTTLDATGPITKDDTLLYRFNLAYQNSGSFRDYVTSNRVFLAPKLRWNISPRTQVNLEFEYMHNEDTPDIGNVPLALNPKGNKPSPMSINQNINQHWANLRGDRALLALDWTHQFNDDWKIHHRFTTEHFNNIFNSAFAPSAAPDGTVKLGFFSVNPSDSQRYFTAMDLTGKFQVLGSKHTVVMGGDYFRNNERYYETYATPGSMLQNTNIFRPVYDANLPVGSLIDQANTTTEWYGLYVQDQVELPFNIHLLGGFRYDNAEIFDNLKGVYANKDDRINPRGGLVWRPFKWLSLYGSYTENFGASNGQQSSDGTFLPSQTAEQWETGFKTEFWDGRLTSNVAYFDLKRQNQRTNDPLNPTRAILVGESESRGVEFDFTGEVLPGWKVISTYAYIPFAKVTQGNEKSFPLVGTRFQGTPEHSGSFWNTYEFLDGRLKGLTFGAGMAAVGTRVGDNANSYSLPGYVTFNLMGRYAWKMGPTKVSAQLNVDNVLDKTYALGTNGSGHIPFGNPLTLMGLLRVEY